MGGILSRLIGGITAGKPEATCSVGPTGHGGCHQIGPWRPPRRKAAPVAGSVVPRLPANQAHRRVGGDLSPEQVSSIIRLADEGYMYRLVDLATDARLKDCHLQSILYTREMSVAGLPFQCTPPRKGARAAGIAEWVQEALLAFGTYPDAPDEIRDWDSFVSHLAGGDYYGHAVSEIIYRPRGKRDWPIGCIPIMPRRFLYSWEDSSFRLCDIDAGVAGPTGTLPGVDLRKWKPGRFVIYRPRITGGPGPQEGLMRCLVWAALFRSWAIGDWMKLVELTGRPWRVGKFQKKASAEDRDALEEALEWLSTEGYCLLPETVELDIQFSQLDANDLHALLADFLALEMSKAVLGQTLTSQQGKVGSQALGNVHNEVRKEIREKMARAIAAAIRRDLIAPLVRRNFGPDAPIPLFRFLTDDAIDVKAFAEGVKLLVDCGVKMSQRWVRDRAGIPEPERDEEILLGRAPWEELDPEPEEPALPAEPEEPDAEEPEPEDPEPPSSPAPSGDDDEAESGEAGGDGAGDDEAEPPSGPASRPRPVTHRAAS